MEKLISLITIRKPLLTTTQEFEIKLLQDSREQSNSESPIVSDLLRTKFFSEGMADNKIVENPRIEETDEVTQVTNFILYELKIANKYSCESHSMCRTRK